MTIDDLPTVNLAETGERARRDATLGLLTALSERAIPATGFVNEGQLYENGELVEGRVDLLRLWIAAGLDLGNHTYSHPDLHGAPLDQYQDDVLRGETITRSLLEEIGRRPRWFRHPFLHTGRDLATRDALVLFLAEHGYRVAPVSIDNSEWIFARAFMLAMRAADDPLAERIGDDYIAYMLQVVRWYEDQSARVFDRNIAHVLLLHANGLNARWLGRLADALGELGYEFIDLETALADPAYGSRDTYTGPGGITWLHRWALTRGMDKSTFAGEPVTPDYVLEMTELPEHGYR